MNIFKNKKISLLILLIVLTIVTVNLILYKKNTNTENLTIKTNITNNTDYEIKDFNIYIKYKSKKYKNINLISEKNISANNKVEEKTVIDPYGIYSIELKYKKNNKGIYYKSIDVPKNININLSIDNFEPLTISGTLHDGRQEYNIKEVLDD